MPAHCYMVVTNTSFMNTLSKTDTFLDAMPTMTVVLDKHGTIRMVNKMACELTGKSKATLNEQAWTKVFITPAEEEAAQKQLDRILNESNQVPYSGQFRYTGHQGQTKAINWRITPLVDENGRVYGATCSGEECRTAANCTKGDNLCLRFLQHLPDMIFLHEADSGRILDVNNKACETLGYSRAELLAMKVIDLKPRTGLDEYRSVQNELKAAGGPLTFQRTFRRKDGSTIPVEVNVSRFEAEQPLCIAVVRDIGKRIFRQRRLRDSREFLKLLIDSIPEIICIKDDSGRWMLANRYTQELFALGDIDYRGKTDEELSEICPEQYKNAFRACAKGDARCWQTGKLHHYQETIPDQHGAIKYFDVFKVPLFDEQNRPKALLAIGRDITKQKEIEEKFRHLFEQAPVGIVLYDTNLIITDCNERAAKILGTKRNTLKGFDILKDLQDRRILPILQKAIAGEEANIELAYQATLSNKTFDAALRVTPLVNSEGAVTGGMAIITDISRRRMAEREMNLLMSAIEQASETIVVTDRHGFIEYANPAFEKITGYQISDVVGKNPRILKSGHHDLEFYQKMWRTLLKGKVWRGHLVNRKKDGSLFEEDVTISPMRNQDGEISNFVAVKRDVTRERSLERQIHQAMKMEAIGTLAGGIAHDFNNILSVILGFAEIAELQLPTDHKVRDDIARIIEAGQRARKLVHQILTYCRHEDEELRPVRLQRIIKETVGMLRSTLPTTIELRQNIDETCSPVLADPTRIQQIILNLCTNAKQAMEGKQGILSISLQEMSNREQANLIDSDAQQAARWVLLAVRDTGCGMDRKTCDRIFDPFFTTKEQGQGTGLGLSVVHGIVMSHGGTIHVDTEPEKGTTFFISLPVADNLVSEKKSINIHDTAEGNETILLVDDEALLVKLIQRVLEESGYQVHSFTDSRKALEWIWEHGEDVDLVITDMTMPHLTGADLSKAILETWPTMPIILCTGFSEIIDEQEARKIGICRYLSKPVKNTKLIQTVRNLLDNKKNKQ